MSRNLLPRERSFCADFVDSRESCAWIRCKSASCGGTRVAGEESVRRFLLLLVLAGCEKASDAAGPPLPDGETVYMRACAVCHQADGRGLAGRFPSLVTPRRPDKAMQIFLVVNGSSLMPAQRDLSNAHLAAALTYVRTSWGNALEPVSPEDVAKGRF
jgi:mono/diheme cytochrome c family protein